MDSISLKLIVPAYASFASKSYKSAQVGYVITNKPGKSNILIFTYKNKTRN